MFTQIEILLSKNYNDGSYKGGDCLGDCLETELKGLNMTPRQIVEKLDQYIIGQREAKRAVAVALRNRFRREKLNNEMKEEKLFLKIF